ncbi:hypothetical protein [Ideonella sp. YS5]|uniref:hypothetical protein n=1 Tax=Ideonella sp. YS5 TaxID=3453714 RepID=UPI003EEC609B
MTASHAAIKIAVSITLASASLAAAAAPLTPAQRQQVSDMQRMATLGPGAAPAKRGSELAGGPKLTAFSVGPSVDAGSMDAQLRVDLVATDRLSQLNYMSVTATSPDGLQQVSTGYTTGFPSSKVTSAIGLAFNYFHAPGTWNVTQVILYDVAGNQVIYDAAALSNLGPTAFTVKNETWRTDTSPPTASAGKVLTPHVDVKSVAAYAGVQYAINDTGNPKASGPSYATAQFCTLDFANCIYLSHSLTYAGLAKATMRPTTQLYAGYPAGTYYLYILYSTDWAGYTEYLTGADFGGETDFSALFPNGHTITVTN